MLETPAPKGGETEEEKAMQEAVALVAELGFVPANADEPGQARFRQLATQLRQLRNTPQFEALVARRRANEIDGQKFMDEVDKLLTLRPAPSS